MNNNDIQTITPISSNNNQTGITNIENITPVSNIQNKQVQTPITNVNSQNNDDDFAKGLPDWDLIPPYTTVRRVNRK